MHEKYKPLIRQFYTRHKRMPTYRELAEVCGYRSKQAAYRCARALERDGFLTRDTRTGTLLPGKEYGALKLLGLVEAGFPSPAEEEQLDTMSLDEFLIERPESSFLLQVKGDSMKDAGIREGDMVIVDRSKTARSGDIVIAEVDGEWTMKYLEKKGKQTRLVPANPAYRTITPREHLQIAAVVHAVIRKYT